MAMKKANRKTITIKACEDGLDNVWEIRSFRRYRLWLVWELTESGNHGLRAICTSQSSAQKYARWAKAEPGVVASRVEMTLSNHLYADAEKANKL